MVEYFLKTKDGTILENTRTSDPKRISEEEMWYSNRGYEVVIIMEREVPRNQSRLLMID